MTNHSLGIDADLLLAATGIKFPPVHFDSVGDIHARNSQKVLSFLKHHNFIALAAENERITGVFCTEQIARDLPSRIEALVCDDPNWAFFTLVDFLAGRRQLSETKIEGSAIAAGAYVAARGVKLAAGVRLEPFVTIHSGTCIGRDTIVRAGAVLGLDTFQHQRTSQGMVSPRHDGDLIVESEVEIGANSTVSKGFSYRSTIIQQGAKIDAGVYVGHGAQIGRRAIICAGSRIMGHVVIGEDAFIGPGATVSSRVCIGNGARVSIGSVVTRDVGQGEVVTGNFAIPHGDFIRRLKTSTGKQAVGD